MELTALRRKFSQWSDEESQDFVGLLEWRAEERKRQFEREHSGFDIGDLDDHPF